jgi:hypothetical protein
MGHPGIGLVWCSLKVDETQIDITSKVDCILGIKISTLKSFPENF